MSAINLLFSNNFIATPVILAIRFCQLLLPHFHNYFSYEGFPTLFSFGSLPEIPPVASIVFMLFRPLRCVLLFLLLKKTLN